MQLGGLGAAALCAAALVACAGPDRSGPAADLTAEVEATDGVAVVHDLYSQDDFFEGEESLSLTVDLDRDVSDEDACAPVGVFLEGYPDTEIPPSTSSHVEVRDGSDPVGWSFRVNAVAAEPDVAVAYCVASRQTRGIPQASLARTTLDSTDPDRPTTLVYYREGTVRSRAEGLRRAQQSVATYDDFSWAVSVDCEDVACR